MRRIARQPMGFTYAQIAPVGATGAALGQTRRWKCARRSASRSGPARARGTGRRRNVHQRGRGQFRCAALPQEEMEKMLVGAVRNALETYR